MKKIILAMALFFGFGAVAQQGGPPPDLEIPSNMKPYFVVLYVANASSAKAHDNHELIKKHLEYIRRLAESGKIMAAGPFTDGGQFAGMFILSAASTEDARNIVSEDPMVGTHAVDVDVHSVMLPDLSPVKMIYSPKKTP